MTTRTGHVKLAGKINNIFLFSRYIVFHMIVILFRSTCITSNNEFVKEPSEHSGCIADAARCKVQELRATMKRRATEELTSVKRIYSETSEAVADDEAVAAHFQQFESIQTSLYR